MSRVRKHFPSICKCGCGLETAPGKVWRSGHNTVESWTGRKHSEESKIKMSESAKKRISPPCSEEKKRKISEANKGKKRTEEQIKRISESLKGKQAGENHPFYGKKLSEETKRKKSDSLRGKYSGELASNWKGLGNFSSVYNQICHSYFYFNWRDKVLSRDGNTCQKCGSTEGLCSHHIIFVNYIIEKFSIQTMEDAINCNLLWNVNNGITYCRSCHSKYHLEFRRLQKKGIKICGTFRI